MSNVSYNNTERLRFWCQKVLPLVYDDSLSYYELLNKVVVYLNSTIEDVQAMIEDVTRIEQGLSSKIDISQKGVANGVATLNGSGQIPLSQLPDISAGVQTISVNGVNVPADANKNVNIIVMTNAVSNLVNYYLKTETYNKTEVNALIDNVKNSRFEVVAQLPTSDIQTNVIYLVAKSVGQTQNGYDEFINLDGTTSGWELIGSTDIDLSGYVTDGELTTALSAYVTTQSLNTTLAGYVTNGTLASTLEGYVTNAVFNSLVNTVNSKVDWTSYAETGVHNILDPDFNPPSYSNVQNVVSLSDGILTLNGTMASSANYAIKDRQITATGKVKYIPKGTYTYYALGADWENGVQVGTTYNGSFLSLAQSGSDNDRVTFTIDDNTPSDYKLSDGSVLVGFYVKILLGTYSDKIIKPMLCLASDRVTTYSPYAMTNRELTDAVTPKTIPVTTDSRTLTKEGVYKYETIIPIGGSSDINLPTEMENKGVTIVVRHINVGVPTTNTLQQIAYVNNQGYFFMRPCNANTWGDWYKFTGTVV